MLGVPARRHIATWLEFGHTFGVVKAAQARADFEILLERKCRALRAHLGAESPLAWLPCTALVSALRSRAVSSPDLAALRHT
jgi:hypothetical protein